MTKYELIQIYFKEYDALRAEILLRIGHRLTFLSMVGGVGIYAFFLKEPLLPKQIIAIGIAVILLYAIWHQLGNLIVRCSKRIAEIEGEINSLAKADILKWEHEKRGSKIFHAIHR